MKKYKLMIAFLSVKAPCPFPLCFTVLVRHINSLEGQESLHEPISGRVDRASVTATVDSGSIPDRVEPKTIKIGIAMFPCLTFSN